MLTAGVVLILLVSQDTACVGQGGEGPRGPERDSASVIFQGRSLPRILVVAAGMGGEVDLRSLIRIHG